MLAKRPEFVWKQRVLPGNRTEQSTETVQMWDETWAGLGAQQ